MDKQTAYRSFVYWGDRIVTPTGKEDARAREMRAAWAWAYDTGYYKKLPSNDILKADEIVLEVYRIKGKK
jgi:hypothetical protein